MLHVVQIFRRPLPNGYYSIERSFAAIWPETSRRGGVFGKNQTPEGILPFPLDKGTGVGLYRLTACCPSTGIWPRLRILAQMARLRAEVYHVTGDIHFAALALPGKKTILTIHDCGFLRHPNPVARWLLRLFWLTWPVRHCRSITAVSEATKADIVRHTGCSPDKIIVIPSAIPEHFKRVPKAFDSARPRILHIGSAPNKNLRRHIEALRGIPCVLHIVANLGAEEKHLLEQSGTTFVCTPNLDDAGIVQAYEACDLLLFASTLEGFGMPILEAQSVGRPVVTSDCSSMPEVAGDGACFVPPLDTAAIRAGVLRVIRDADFREKLVRQGFDNVRRFSPQAIAAAYRQLYARVVEG